MKTLLKIRRILGAVLLVQFVLFNALVQYHHSAHPSDHGCHQVICLPPEGASPARNADDLAPRTERAVSHNACAICILSATSQPVPAGDISPLTAGALRMVSVPPADSPNCTAAEIRCGRAPPFSA